jgi:hypothetical protein
MSVWKRSLCRADSPSPIWQINDSQTLVVGQFKSEAILILYNLSRCHFAPHKSHTDHIKNEIGPEAEN